MTQSRFAIIAIVVGLIVVATACSSVGTRLPPSPSVVEVTMADYSFEHRGKTSVGRVVFEAMNVGTLQHEMVLAKLPEGFPPIAEQLQGSTRRVVDTIATIQRRGPGRRGVIAVTLEPGRYALLCFVTEGDGEAHARKGMNAEFLVAG